MFFFCNDPETTEVYTLALHEALRISLSRLTRMLGKPVGWTRLADFLPPGLVNDLIGRGKVAATFAACLELTRQGRLRLRQSKPFAPLFLRGVAKPS